MLRVGFAIVALGMLCVLGSTAEAGTASCVAGGTPAAPLDYGDPATWGPAAVPDATTDVLLATPCTVRCSAGECHAHTLRGTNAAAALEITAGAALALSGCEDAPAADPGRYECGGENGFRFAPQGALDPRLGAATARWCCAAPRCLPSRIACAWCSRQAIDAAPGDGSRCAAGRRAITSIASRPSTSRLPRSRALLSRSAAARSRHGVRTRLADGGVCDGVGYVGRRCRAHCGRRPVPVDGVDLTRCIELCSCVAATNCVASTAVTRSHSYAGFRFAGAPTRR